MKLSIKQTIYQAILGSQWVELRYENVKKEQTSFCMAIDDIDTKKGSIHGSIFNSFKALDARDTWIKIDAILDAKLIEQSFYLTGDSLAKRLSDDPELAAFLEGDALDNNILCYLSDCYRLDNDPYLKESLVLDGIDIKTLLAEKRILLEEEDFRTMLAVLFRNKNRFEAEDSSRFFDFAINSFSIDVVDKQYVVAYHRLSLDFKTRELRMDINPTINKYFLIDDKRMSLSTYLDMNPDEFCRDFGEKKREFIEEIQDNYHYGEKTNTRPTIFLIERHALAGVNQAFATISEMEKEGKLTHPLKSFFGRNRVVLLNKKEPKIVAFDKDKVNIDQMRVVFNSMVNHVTFVQGPPGTGKTETIFNVILSGYCNKMALLVCSNNNHPIDDISKRLKKTFGQDAKRYSVRFPFIRLGNREELKKAIYQIRDDIETAKLHRDDKVYEGKTNQSIENFAQSFSGMREMLQRYEERIETKERVEILEHLSLIAGCDRVKEEIDKQLAVLRNKLSSFSSEKEIELADYMISAKGDKRFSDYIHFSSLSHLLKLLSPIYQELRDIAANENDEEAVSAFAQYLKDDKNFHRFQDIYPIILCTNLSSERLGSATTHFDLCIMDEAGQCNIATSLVPIVRGKNLLLVGDVNQLQPVTVIEPGINEKLKVSYHVGNEYDYMKNSILSTMQAKDRNSKSILLRYHYRCGRSIAGFSNQRFYNNELKLINENPGELIYCSVQNERSGPDRNSYLNEAAEVVRIIKDNGYKDVGIITPFVNQANLINILLAKEGITDIKAGTVHTLQGSEKGTIVFSAGISRKTAQKTMDWIKNNHELINVGVTRSKERFIFVGDKEAIDLKSQGKTNDIKALSDYISSKGESIVATVEDRSFVNFSNDSKSEKEFFDTIAPYFRKRKAKLKIERNVPVVKAIPKILPSDKERAGAMEFDLIVQAAENGLLAKKYRTIIAFEIDGGEHVGSLETVKRDRKKESICKFYHVKLIRVGNHQVKDYEMIISVIECVLKEIKNIEDIYTQGSLFEKDETVQLPS